MGLFNNGPYTNLHEMNLQWVIKKVKALTELVADTITEFNESLDTLEAEIQAKQDTLTFDSTPTSGSTNPVTSGGVYTSLTDKQDALEYVEMTSSDTTVTLAADHYYAFPEMSSLTVTCPATGGVYAFRFESGSTATTLTISGITMPDSFSVEADTVYEITVYDGYARVTKWSDNPVDTTPGWKLLKSYTFADDVSTGNYTVLSASEIPASASEIYGIVLWPALSAAVGSIYFKFFGSQYSFAGASTYAINIYFHLGLGSSSYSLERSGGTGQNHQWDSFPNVQAQGKYWKADSTPLVVRFAGSAGVPGGVINLYWR